MLHLTTEINNIDFSNNLNIHSGDRFVVTSNDMQLDVGEEPGHGYHILFKNNGHVLSDFHGVQAEEFIFDVKNHNLKASFLVNPMAPFEALDKDSHPNFLVSMHTASDCVANCTTDELHSHATHAGGESESLINQITSSGESIILQPAVIDNTSENVNVPESVVSVLSDNNVSEDTEDSDNSDNATAQVSSESEPQSRFVELSKKIRDTESFEREEQIAAQFGGKYFYF
ncbi:TRP47 family tandem repeat effector [Ehrlichia muris]|uniref:TRP47 family tandem repeat effector n=1 Tax=Ehrlichia muris TaxID=35795 RepID=UPI0037C0C9A7